MLHRYSLLRGIGEFVSSVAVSVNREMQIVARRLTDLYGCRHNVYSLRRIDLSSCTQLTDVSILSSCTYLESLCLDHCEALTRIPDLDGKYLQSFLLGRCGEKM